MPNFKVFTLSQEELIDLRLYQSGYEKCEPLHLYGPAVRNHFLFHYIVSGSGTLQSTTPDGQTKNYRLNPNQGFLISPNQINTYFADEYIPWNYIWIEVDGLHAKQIFNLAGLNMDNPIFTPKLGKSPNELISQLTFLSESSNRSSYCVVGHLFLALDALIETSNNKKKIGGTRRQDFYIQQAVQFIENNYKYDISIEDIANYCGLNRSYLGKIFRQTISTSLQEFLINYRLSKACTLLKSSDLSIREIAESVGYPNQLHFSRAFKNKFDESPSKWKEHNSIH